MSNIEQTLSIIKPDAVERNLDGENASTWVPLDRIEVEKLLAGEADRE